MICLLLLFFNKYQPQPTWMQHDTKHYKTIILKKRKKEETLCPLTLLAVVGPDVDYVDDHCGDETAGVGEGPV